MGRYYSRQEQLEMLASIRKVLPEKDVFVIVYFIELFVFVFFRGDAGHFKLNK